MRYGAQAHDGIALGDGLALSFVGTGSIRDGIAVPSLMNDATGPVSPGQLTKLNIKSALKV